MKRILGSNRKSTGSAPKHQWLFIIVWMQASFTLASDAPVAEHVYRIPKKAAFEWHLADEWRVWLTAVAYNSDADWAKDGYNPSFTYLMSDYKPMVKKIDGKWQIAFTSEIAEGLP